MSEHREPDWLRPLRRELDASAERLDAATRSRLTRARHAALSERGRPRRHWLAGGAAGVAAAAALAAVLWLQPAPEPDLIDDLEIVAGRADLEFYRELEFYAWLDGETG
ncbi:MAG: hypothetical protein R3202_02465 [Candidatus Competibacterales bacterium]|nr:hypothetical protein [Candidatus Competibacterales bacterium]